MINQRWFPSRVRNGSKEEREKFEKMIRGSASGLGRLKTIVEEELRAVEAPKPLDDYDPGWPFKQADRLGQIRSYKKLLTLLEFINDRE